MWFLPLLFVLGAGAVATGCNPFGNSSTPPRRNPPPPPPPRSLDEYQMQQNEDCGAFRRRVRPMGFNHPAALLRELRTIWPYVLQYQQRNDYIGMGQDARIARITGPLQNSSVLFAEGTPSIIDTQADYQSLVTLYGALEALESSTSAEVNSLWAVDAPDAANPPIIWQVVLFGVRTYTPGSAANPPHLILSAASMRGFTETFDTCQIAVRGWRRVDSSPVTMR